MHSSLGKIADNSLLARARERSPTPLSPPAHSPRRLGFQRSTRCASPPPWLNCFNFVLLYWHECLGLRQFLTLTHSTCRANGLAYSRACGCFRTPQRVYLTVPRSNHQGVSIGAESSWRFSSRGLNFSSMILMLSARFALSVPKSFNASSPMKNLRWRFTAALKSELQVNGKCSLPSLFAEHFGQANSDSVGPK